jgi:phospho-N-acetylmuramoyl-pentapeptide-transferase
MIYHLSLCFKQHAHLFNVIHYVSFRAIAALLTSLVFSFLFGNWFIEKSKLFFRSKARELTPDTHRAKDGMPTGGGLFILSNVVFCALLWANLSQVMVWLFLFCLIGNGAIGFWDDWCKIRYKKGISARTKLFFQVLVALIVVLLWLWLTDALTTVTIPFFKNLNPDLGWLFIPWAVLIIFGCSSAVNLTDGLDGLAISSLIPNFVTFSIICYLAGHYKMAAYLNIPFADSSEIAVLGATLVGASLGFLWYNTYPAQIFMGDVGSLALGSALALMALFSKQELLLAIAGGLFVVEALSVIIQVWSFRYLGKRLFKMAPIHHHYELHGWQESKITVRFGIISLILCLVALLTLKMR